MVSSGRALESLQTGRLSPEIERREGRGGVQPCVPRGYGALPSPVIPDHRPVERWLAYVWWLLFFESRAEDSFPPGLRVVFGRKFPVGLPEIIYPDAPLSWRAPEIFVLQRWRSRARSATHAAHVQMGIAA